MALPLFTTRATFEGLPLVHVEPRNRLVDRADRATPRPGSCGVDVTGRMPDRQPGPGEQFRFHVDMDRCIGCKCCVVACNEQNGNPATVNWRRVGEIEGGVYPQARRAYFSMGCNHCADPTCLAGCPVDAYTKDAGTGIVRHDAETCIGCQYCTWTCSYGVPQFNAERGVVGKCDMCHGRLALGQAPACVSACPEGALAIEIVNVAEWRAAVAASAAVEGRPADDASTSMTRVTLPASLPAATRPIDLDRVGLEHAHAPLVVMTVLTQLSVGAFAAIWLAHWLGGAARAAEAALAALVLGGGALGAASLHLGRPIHAYRAMKMWRRSWLSREAVLFTAFIHAAAGYVGALWAVRGLPIPGLTAIAAAPWLAPATTALGAVTVALGAAGVFATGRIYLVTSRPSWNTPLTILRFFLTAALLGPLLAAAAGADPLGLARVVSPAAAAALVGVLVVLRRRFEASPFAELRGTARLFRTTLATRLGARLGLLVGGGVILPLASADPRVCLVALVAAAAGELLGRYLFFVSAVPRHMTASYLDAAREAA